MKSWHPESLNTPITRNDKKAKKSTLTFIRPNFIKKLLCLLKGLDMPSATA